jgi:hypothetical protein
LLRCGDFHSVLITFYIEILITTSSVDSWIR